MARSLGLVLTFVLLPALVLVLLWVGQRRLIYLPWRGIPPLSTVGLPNSVSAVLTTEDGLTLNGWFVPAAAPATGHTMIVFNGNAGHRGLRAPLAAALARRGIATLLMDYRGYGENPGTPSEEGLARDARAARAYVAGRADVDPARIVYFGESLGTGVAVRLAMDHPPFALILRSPFTSMVDVGRYHYPFLPVKWMLRDRYESLDRIPQVTCPVLVIAGDRDSIIPAAQSERVYAAVRSPKRLVMIPGADHNDEELFAGPRLIASVMQFLTGRQ